MAKVNENYEAVVIFSMKQGEEEIKALIEKFSALIEKNGTLEGVEEWGKRTPVSYTHLMQAKKNGVKIIAVSSTQWQQEMPADHFIRHPNHTNLFDYADVCIDDYNPVGDAVVNVPGLDTPIAPVSNIIDFYIDVYKRQGYDDVIGVHLQLVGGDGAHKLCLFDAIGIAGIGDTAVDDNRLSSAVFQVAFGHVQRRSLDLVLGVNSGGDGRFIGDDKP